MKMVNVLDPESLAEYRRDVVEKHKAIHPLSYLHKPIEHYINNRFAFTQAWFAVELENWHGYPDLFDIFKVFNMDGKAFNDLSKSVQYEKKQIEKQKHVERKQITREKIQLDKPSKISDTFSPSMRWKVLERDGFKCVKCGRSAADGVKLHADHIYPKSRGGMATLDNGQTLCDECNIGKGARVPETHPTNACSGFAYRLSKFIESGATRHR